MLERARLLMAAAEEVDQALADLQGELTKQHLHEAATVSVFRSALFGAAKATFRRSVLGIMRSFRAGNITALEASTAFEDLYRTAATTSYEVGLERAGAVLTSERIAWIERETMATTGDFARLLHDIETDNVRHTGGVSARTNLIVNRVDAVRNDGWADGGEAPGTLWFWNITIGEVCDDCVSLFMMSPFKDKPPTVPRESATRCGCILDPGARVITRGGHIPIADVRVGDEVLTHMGRFRKVLHAHKRRGSFDLVRVGGVVATAQHHWMTDRGWLPAPRLPVYSSDHGFLQRVWRENTFRFGRWDMSPVPVDMRMRCGEGSPGSALSSLWHARKGEGAVEHHRRQDAHCPQCGRQGSSGTIRGSDGVQFPCTGRRTFYGAILGREALETHLSLSLAMGENKRPHSRWYGYSSPKRRSDRRPVGEFGIDDKGFSQFSAHDREQAWVSRSRREGDCAQIPTRRDVENDRRLAWDLCRSSTASNRAEWVCNQATELSTVYDLSVEEDASYVVEGLISHNSNCRCFLTRVDRSVRESWQMRAVEDLIAEARCSRKRGDPDHALERQVVLAAERARFDPGKVAPGLWEDPDWRCTSLSAHTVHLHEGH